MPVAPPLCAAPRVAALPLRQSVRLSLSAKSSSMFLSKKSVKSISVMTYQPNEHHRQPATLPWSLLLTTSSLLGDYSVHSVWASGRLGELWPC